MKQFLHLLLALPLVGCVSNVHHIGNIGEHKFYSIHEQSLNGPNVAVIAVQTPDGGINYLTSATGPGIATAVVGAGGNVGASALLRPARSSVTVSGNGNGESSAAASASSSSSGSSGFVPPGLQDNPGHSK